MSSPAVFFDRDGTLMEEVEYCRDPALVRLLPGVPEGLARLKAAGFKLVIITNQSGIGRGWITEEEYAAVHVRLLELLGKGVMDATYYCGDHPDRPTERRKPGSGMLLEAARDLDLELSASYLIGDRASDVESARRAGARGILVKTGYGAAQAVEAAVFVGEGLADAVEFILSQGE